ncbi:hypothetical protein RYX36_025715 [Vicia faba]
MQCDSSSCTRTQHSSPLFYSGHDAQLFSDFLSTKGHLGLIFPSVPPRANLVDHGSLPYQLRASASFRSPFNLRHISSPLISMFNHAIVMASSSEIQRDRECGSVEFRGIQRFAEKVRLRSFWIFCRIVRNESCPR